MALLTVGLSYDFILLDSKGQAIPGGKKTLKYIQFPTSLTFFAVLNTI